jgi:hypothetical protein
VNIRTITEDDFAQWPGGVCQVFGAPEGMEDSVAACEGLVARHVVHNVVAHPLLVIWPAAGEWLHDRTSP